MPVKYKVGIAVINRDEWFADPIVAAEALEAQIKNLRPADSTLLSAAVMPLRGQYRWVCIFAKDTTP